MKRYRVGPHLKVNVIQYETDEQPDDRGHRPSDLLFATAQAPEDAQLIADALNSVPERSSTQPRTCGNV